MIDIEEYAEDMLKPSNSRDGIDAKSKKPNVAIMTSNDSYKSAAPLDNLIALINPLANRLFIIIGDYSSSIPDVEIVKIKVTKRTLLVARVLHQVLIHVWFLRFLFRMRRDIDILIYIFGPAFPLPLLFAQFLNIKCFIVLAIEDSAKLAQALEESGGASRQFGELTRLRTTAVLERISYHFADKLVVYTPSMIDTMKLRRYEKKTVVAHKHFVNLDEFTFKNNIERRADAVGYVGRFTVEKGVLSFVEAIPKILSVRDDVKFLIIGEGNLEDEIRTRLDTYALHGNVKVLGWIPHNELPDYLGSLKLLVLPSLFEGLPNVMLEAMACGTPVVVTRVGSVPDVIKDKETGFLIRDNSPVHLAKTIMETLASPDLKRVATNARNLVENEFRRGKVADTWENIIYSTKKA